MSLRSPRLLALVAGVLVASGSAAMVTFGLPASRSAPRTTAALSPAARVETTAVAPAEPASQTRPVAVTKLSQLRAPDLMVTATKPLTILQLAALRRIKGVTALTALNLGSVRVGTRTLHTAGIDPSTFRGFTPKPSAGSDPLWAAVARGEVSSSYAAKLPLGATVGLAGLPTRVGAIAAFDLPGIDVVVNQATARHLGVAQNSALVAAPDRAVTGLQRDVRAVAGGALRITVLRPAKVVSHRPSTYRELYIKSAQYCPGLSWTVLAAIGQIESGHGRNIGASSAGARGPMQFMPATWATYGVNGDGDSTVDINSPYDAVPSAALYLCRNGAGRGGQDLYNAVFSYNHADWYVREVLGLAARYT